MVAVVVHMTRCECREDAAAVCADTAIGAHLGRRLLSSCLVYCAAGFREALTATAEDLLSMNVIPVFNENDAILSAMPLLVS